MRARSEAKVRDVITITAWQPVDGKDAPAFPPPASLTNPPKPPTLLSHSCCSHTHSPTLFNSLLLRFPMSLVIHYFHFCLNTVKFFLLPISYSLQVYSHSQLQSLIPLFPVTRLAIILSQIFSGSTNVSFSLSLSLLVFLTQHIIPSITRTSITF